MKKFIGRVLSVPTLPLRKRSDSMGVGTSRTRNFEIVELEPDAEGGESIFVDLDSDLISKMRDDYEEGLLSFSMSEDEFREYINSHEIGTVYGWGLNKEGDVDINYLTEIFTVKDPDLRYAMYSALETGLTIQKAFQECTGTNKKVVDYVTFDSHEDNYNLSLSTKGLAEGVYVSEPGVKPYQSSTITVNVSKDLRLNSDQARHHKDTGLFVDPSNMSTATAVIRERSGSTNGWFSASGSYSKTIMTHEMGHAVYTSMKGFFSSSFSDALIKKWHERTYNSPVSGYAQYNHKESFAECFSLYVVGGKSSSKMYSEFKDIMSDFGLSNMFGCVK